MNVFCCPRVMDRVEQAYAHAVEAYVPAAEVLA